ncbi:MULTISPECIES: porin [Shewanella]|uniref:Class 1 protein n=2 Tax=Bacteria TaxID=2 RepID=A0A379Z2C6_9GAMM|nr:MULTISPECIES: porin [Shewanella]EKT4489352.1 porin [Shewanella algae]MBO2548435.1 porin [Shewanella algae]MBO2606433.1 porin [Shewanella algae]MBO2669501.1 porin [Shewanella algae]MCT8982059.1 porin [Shewanella algae]
MKKTLISASVATVLAAASFGALADGPTLYGRLDLAVTNSDQGSTLQTGTSGVKEGENGTYIENNFSHLGVKGSEKLTDGIDIIYQMEFQVENTSGSGDTFKARNTYLGAKGKYGTVLVGRNDTVFKQAEGGVDAFGNTNADIDRMVGGQVRSGDGVWYYSPKIADLITLNATYLMDDNYQTVKDPNGNVVEADELYALSATIGDKKLKAQNYYAAIAYNKGIGGIDAYRAVGQVKLGDFKLGGLFQNSESIVDGSDDNNTYFVNVVYNLNGVNLKLQYGYDEAGFGKYFQNIGVDGTAVKTAYDAEITNITVGADYRVAKSTLLFAHYANYQGEFKDTNGAKFDLEDDNVFTVGVRYDF